MKDMLRARSRILALAAVSWSFALVFACGDDGGGGGSSSAPDGGSSNGGEGGATDGGSGGDGSSAEGGKTCASSAPFTDDFENEAKLGECWDGLVVSGPGAAGHVAELSNALGDKQGTVFHLLLKGTQAAPSNAEAYLKKTFTPPIAAPSRVAYRWRVDKLADLGTDGDKGYTAIAVRYQYKDGAGTKEATANVFIGVEGANVNPYLEKPDGHVPIHELETKTWHLSELELRGTTLKIRTDQADAFTRTAPLAGEAAALLELRIGVVAIDAVTADWELRYDDVAADRAP